MPTVAITGAAGAIGSVTAEVFSDAGWDLALLDYGSDNHATLNASFPDAQVFDADLTDADAAQDAFDAIESAGALDAVLAIAGGFAMQSAVEATADDYAHMMDLNVRTLFNTARAAVPVLTEQEHSFLLGVSAPAGTTQAEETATSAASSLVGTNTGDNIFGLVTGVASSVSEIFKAAFALPDLLGAIGIPAA